MIPSEVTLSSLSTSLAKHDEAVAKQLEAHTLRLVSAAARDVFNGLIKELRLRGIDLQAFGTQSDAEIHYRAPLAATDTSAELVFALDIVVTVGATAR